MGRKRSWTDEGLAVAVKNSLCWAEAGEKLGLSRGASIRRLREAAIKLGICFEHFDRKKALAMIRGPNGARLPRKKTLKEILVQGKYFHTTHLKNRLLSEGVLDYVCAECSLTEWRGKPLTLQLDHVNGDNSDNRLENLRILCPNCHTQTPTWGAKGRTWGGSETQNLCCGCHIPVSPGAQRCRSCASFRQPTKIEWPDTELLRQKVQASSRVQVAKELGVSDNAVKKRLMRH